MKYTICYKQHDSRSWESVIVRSHKEAVSTISKMLESYAFSTIKVFDKDDTLVKNCEGLIDMSSLDNYGLGYDISVDDYVKMSNLQ